MAFILLNSTIGRECLFRGSSHVLPRRQFPPGHLRVGYRNNFSSLSRKESFSIVERRSYLLRRSAEGWHLLDQNGTSHGPFDLVVSSAPRRKPQDSCHRNSTVIWRSRRQKWWLIHIYDRADAPDRLPFAAARGEELVPNWLAVDSSEPDRHGKRSLVIHSRDRTNIFSEADRDLVKATMLKALADITPHDFSGPPGGISTAGVLPMSTGR